MKRFHLFEIHESPWLPQAARDAITDFLRFISDYFKPYRPVTAKLGEALRKTQCSQVIDLCSGAGGPIASLSRDLRASDIPDLQVLLTDKYPSIHAKQRLLSERNAGLKYLTQPVDALSLNELPQGFYTMFTSFHHFRPHEAKQILAEIQTRGVGVGIFEVTERTFFAQLRLIPIMLCTFIVTPFLQPKVPSRFIFTYLFPIVPLITLLDGFVSNLRSYTPSELRALVQTNQFSDWEWEIGRLPSSFGCGITYLIGYPLSSNGSV